MPTSPVMTRNRRRIGECEFEVVGSWIARWDGSRRIRRYGKKTIDEEKREEVFGAEAGDSFLRDVECAEDTS